LGIAESLPCFLNFILAKKSQAEISSRLDGFRRMSFRHGEQRHEFGSRPARSHAARIRCRMDSRLSANATVECYVVSGS